MLLFLAAGIGHVQAQKITECQVTYDIDLSDPDMDPMAKMMMNGMKMKMAFQDGKARVDMKMTMMKMSAIVNEGEKEGVVLMKMMGKKMAIPMTEEEFEGTGDPVEDYEVEYTGKSKKVAGYSCDQVLVKTGEGETFELWCTDKIEAATTRTGYGYSKVNGFPLEMDVNQDGMIIKMKATQVSTDKFEDGFFDTTIPEGYEIMDQDDLQKMGQ